MACLSNMFKMTTRHFLSDIDRAYCRDNANLGSDPTQWMWYHDEKDGETVGWRPWLKTIPAKLERSDAKFFDRHNYSMFEECVYMMKLSNPDELDNHPDWRYILPEFHLLVLENERANDAEFPDQNHRRRPEPANAALHKLLVDMS
jgi:hypothetical protein